MKQATIVLVCSIISLVLLGAPAAPASGNPPTTFDLAEFQLVLESVAHARGTVQRSLMSIQGNGRARYQTVIGDEAIARDFEVKTEDIQAIVRSLYQEDFFGIRDSYEDGPTVEFKDRGKVQVLGGNAASPCKTVVTVTIGGYKKSVSYSSNSLPPQNLKAVIKQLEDLSNEYSAIGPDVRLCRRRDLRG